MHLWELKVYYSILSAFVTVIVYNFCVKRNITIKMPKRSTADISQVFKDLIPFSAVIIIYALDLVIRNSFKSNVAEGILKLFEPLFTAADGWIGVSYLSLVPLHYSGL